jgi:hypothetical protein
MIDRVYRRRPGVVADGTPARPSGSRLGRLLDRPAVFVPMIACVIAGWWSAVDGTRWRLTLDGESSGSFISRDGLGVIIGYRWGWPSRDWIRREKFRDAGTTQPTPRNLVDLFIVRGGDTWYGQPNIAVAMHGVRLPWPYLLLAVAVVPFDRRLRPRMRRWRRRYRVTRRRRARRHVSLTCAGCGYDLRASRVRCPECGTPIPWRVRSELDRRFGRPRDGSGVS